jgi:hypothetical protein
LNILQWEIQQGSLRHLRAWGLLLFATFLSATLFGDCLPAKAEPGWVLTQKSTTLGDQYVYISQEGLKITNPRRGFNLVTHAPDWDIVLYNDKTRCFYQTTATHYRNELAGRNGSDFKNSHWSKSGETTIGGLKATEFRLGAKTLQGRNKAGQITTKSIASAQYWVASDIKIPDNLTELLAAAYGLPNETSSSIPLRLTYSENGGEHTVLDTYRVDKSPIPANYFAKPAGYKMVQSDAEVMMNDDQRQIMNDMARDLGSDPQSAQLKQKIDQVKAGNSQAVNSFTKDDVNKLLDMFSKKRQ